MLPLEALGRVPPTPSRFPRRQVFLAVATWLQPPPWLACGPPRLSVSSAITECPGLPYPSVQGPHFQMRSHSKLHSGQYPTTSVAPSGRTPLNTEQAVRCSPGRGSSPQGEGGSPHPGRESHPGWGSSGWSSFPPGPATPGHPLGSILATSGHVPCGWGCMARLVPSTGCRGWGLAMTLSLGDEVGLDNTVSYPYLPNDS